MSHRISFNIFYLQICHEWEQSTVEAEHIISRLTIEGQTVPDPMMGSGPTGIATIQNNRKFMGIEIDSDKFEIANARIGKASHRRDFYLFYNI